MFNFLVSLRAASTPLFYSIVHPNTTMTNSSEEQPSNQLDPSYRPRRRFPGSTTVIYLVIAVILVALNLFQWGNPPVQTTWKQFSTEMLAANHVQRLQVMNGEAVEIYIFPDTIKNSAYYKDILPNHFGNEVPNGPHFQLTIQSAKQFEEQLDEAQSAVAIADRITAAYITTSGIGHIMTWLLPIGILLMASIVIFRRMNR